MVLEVLSILIVGCFLLGERRGLTPLQFGSVNRHGGAQGAFGSGHELHSEIKAALVGE